MKNAFVDTSVITFSEGSVRKAEGDGMFASRPKEKDSAIKMC